MIAELLPDGGVVSCSPTIPDTIRTVLRIDIKNLRVPSCLVFLTRHMSALNSTILSSIAGEDNQLAAGAIGAVAIVVLTAVYYALGSEDEEHEFPKLGGIQIYHAWNFFRHRFDFLQSGFNRNSGKSFSFKVLHHTVVALTGEEGRQVFFSDPHLGFNEGYMILMGAVRVSLSRWSNVLFISTTLGSKN